MIRNYDTSPQSDDLENKLADLMTAFYAGDDHAFELVYREFISQLSNRAKARLRGARFGLRCVIDAEDLVQELFLKVLNTRSCKKGVYLTSRNRLPAWLNRILDNIVWDLLRGPRYRSETLEKELVARPAPTELNEVLAMVATLPPDLREIIEMCDLGGSSYKKFGEQRGISPATVCRQRQLALKKLREWLV